MLKKVALACCALLLLSGCSSSKNCSVSGGRASSSCDLSEFERIGDRVFFALNSSQLSKESQETLMNQAKWFRANCSAKATIEGHCDERGTREYNIALGEARAEAVKKFLVMHGASESNLTTISYGKERPAVMGDNESAWAKNRRGVVSVR